MARKDYFVAEDTRHPLYRTRMLTAGDPIPLDASAARLYAQLGVNLLEDAPKRTAKPAAPEKAEAPEPKPKPKRAPRKRAAKKK